MLEPGDIFETANGRKIVVYRVSDRGVFYDSLPSGAGGGACCGPQSIQRFLSYHPRPVARMRFNGAYQLFRREQDERWRQIRRAREAEAKLARVPTLVRRLFGAH